MTSSNVLTFLAKQTLLTFFTTNLYTNLSPEGFFILPSIDLADITVGEG